MVTTIAVLYIISGIVEIISSILIGFKTYHKPKKIRHILLIFSIITIPASIMNILNYMDIVSNKWNSFSYLIVTTLLLTLHLWLNLDIGRSLRGGYIQYKNPLVVAGVIALAGALICLVCQIVILLVRDDDYPIRPAFVTGVSLAIFCDGVTYMYSFSALVKLRSQRVHEGQSRTTSLGVWFLLIQSMWYGVYGILYIWFFCQKWELFNHLLVFDYLLRFILCLMFTWSPPRYIIDYMSGKIFHTLSHNGKSVDMGDNGSTLAMTDDKESNVGRHHTSSEQYTRETYNV